MANILHPSSDPKNQQVELFRNYNVKLFENQDDLIMMQEFQLLYHLCSDLCSALK